MLTELIKQVLPRGSMEWEDLRSTCATRLERKIPAEELETALTELCNAGDLVREEDLVRRVEPDFNEALLEDAVEPHLTGRWCFETLRIVAAEMVSHRTARGGARDTGLFSRPDFTLATVRRLTYDPLRRLDVITFELKNNSGATLIAVHEALAHTRFAHYSFVVCPRSRLRPSEVLREACAQHGIGLIMFDILGPSSPPRISVPSLEVKPRRMTPDPFAVEDFLIQRFPPDTLGRLKDIAGRS